jgi:hypothetical protein
MSLQGVLQKVLRDKISAVNYFDVKGEARDTRKLCQKNNTYISMGPVIGLVSNNCRSSENNYEVYM